MPLIEASFTLFPQIYHEVGKIVEEVVNELKKSFNILSIELSTAEKRYLLIYEYGDKKGIAKITVKEGGYEITLEIIIFSDERSIIEFLISIIKILINFGKISYFEIVKK